MMITKKLSAGMRGAGLCCIVVLGLMGILGSGDDENTSEDAPQETTAWRLAQEEHVDARVHVYSYDGEDRLIIKDIYESLDAVDSGSPVEIRTFEYDTADNLVLENVYLGSSSSGEVNDVIIYTYDASDTKIEGDLDEGNDGTIDERYRYNSRGDRNYRNDISEGKVYTYSYLYDEQGSISQANTDEDGDGEFDTTATVENSYDTRGNLSRSEWDNDSNDTMDLIQYTWEAF
jgi:YD repeat-containing protein